MTDKALFHQIHPLKLSTDIAGGIVSTWLMWRHELGLALITGLVPSIAVSAAMIRWMSFERQRDSALGRYIARYMTPAAQAVRLGGQILMWAAAWAHTGIGVACGLLVIAGAWTYGLLADARPPR